MAPGSVYSTEVGSAEVVAEQYHLAIIESGATGEKAAAQAAYFGKRVIVFEKERAPGGAAVQTRHSAQQNTPGVIRFSLRPQVETALRSCGRADSRCHAREAHFTHRCHPGR